MGHFLECALSAVYRRYSPGRDPKEPFRTPTPLWRRIAVAGLDVPFALQAIERRINCADRYFSLCTEFDFPPHRDSIRSIFQPQQCQDNDVFEFAEMIASTHYLYNIEQMSASQTILAHLSVKTLLV
jgi:hypothetical protein